MKKLLLVHGANLNRLGKRDPAQYGSISLPELEQAVRVKAKSLEYELKCFQSNHEGALIDFIQENSEDACGMLINPGAFSHTSYALHDAIVDSNLPTVEVHLSDIKAREPWRAHSVIAQACIESISGKKIQGYFEALDVLGRTIDAN